MCTSPGTESTRWRGNPIDEHAFQAAAVAAFYGMKGLDTITKRARPGPWEFTVPQLALIAASVSAWVGAICLMPGACLLA